MIQLQYILRPFAILLFSVVAFACSNDDGKADCENGSRSACGVCDPAKNMGWLRDEIAKMTTETGSYFAIFKGTYQYKTVFVTDGCCPSCICMNVLWNCEGQWLNQDGTPTVDLHDIRNKEVVWQGANYERSL